MSESELGRKFKVHQVYAEALQAHLTRLWGRDLTDVERNVVQSSTLCCSFMSLEASDRSLHFAKSKEDAMTEYEYLQTEVAKYSDEVVKEIQSRWGNRGDFPVRADYPNLLAWEAAVHARLDGA